ncbi:GT2 family glycosyltransferase [Algoriphagus boseongensis]|uniref:GT2 family glycosyltransferase n=1 Tax=Algoriphagus boseongensis TaxID=1442587 RepID=A0A4R6TCW6_9BACT|nr:glycosyltransferase [Algoriphagus boseongensis]TDQ19575.1 GT2 family glycosyltransferase [Algoriphagus boseongensis]
MGEGVSIILCTFNGKDRLPSTLEAIQKLDSKVPIELILVDNASTDGTGEWVNDYFKTSNLDFPARYISESKPGLIHARVAGIKSASFNFLLFCDDDNSLATDYLSVGFQLFKSNPKLGVLGGNGIPDMEGPEPDWLSRYQKSFALGPQAERSGKIQERPGYVYGAAAFFRKKPLLNLINSGYHFYLTGRTQTQVISGDDLELCWLMQLMGYEIHYAENLKFFHTMPPSRMTTDYLIKMKSGTAAGSGLLYSYRYFIQHPNSSSFKFKLAYFSQLLKAGLIFQKHKWKQAVKSQSWEKNLALAILSSRWTSFKENYSLAKALFSQLQSKSEFWKLNP